MKSPLLTASFEDIRTGKVADVYFERTRQILQARGINAHVTAEVVVKRFPGGESWGVFSGLRELLPLFEGVPVSIKAIPEGSLFREHEPVLVIEGRYLDFGVLETALLGLICQASGVATEAARLRLAAGDKTLLSFGARRMHPAIAPMLEWNAYIGGCDGVAVVKSAELLGIPPSGTIPHALVLLIGDTVEAVRAFDEVIDPGVNRIALIDTFQDERFEAVRVAEALGKRLFGIRLDTPGSRRGNLKEIIQEIRWELRLRDLDHVKIFVSGGLEEEDIRELATVADGFGVGTSLSNARVLDFSLDIVEVEGKPASKRGKMSGKKQLIRCERCLQSRVLAEKEITPQLCTCGHSMVPLLQPVVEKGRVLFDFPPPQKVRSYVLQQLNILSGHHPQACHESSHSA